MLGLKLLTDVVIRFSDNPLIEQRMNCYIMYALLEGLYGKCFHPKVSGFQTGNINGYLLWNPLPMS